MAETTGTRPVYDVLAETFRREGVETCFALQGDANMCFATRLADRGCRMIHVRHEHCAVSAATSFARKTGQVGVATVTCGPGMTQIMTALTTAVQIRAPLVVFAGESPLRKTWYNQKVDQGPYVTATGAAYHPLHWGPLMPAGIRDAFLQARKERRPVVIGVPSDLQEDDWDHAVELPVPAVELMPNILPPAPHPVEIARAAELVETSCRIVVVAGLGAADAGAREACRRLAEKVDALVGTTLPNRGFFNEDPFDLGIVGGYATSTAKTELAKADLVIAVGCSLKHHNAKGGKLYPKAQVLQIDTDPVATSQGDVVARHHIRADALLGVEALTEAVSGRPAEWRTSDLADGLAAPAHDDAGVEPGLHDPRRVVAALQEVIPYDWELVNTSGHVSAFTAHMPGRPSDRFLTIREFGTIGNGTSYATGVAAARPDRPVVLLDGDGSLLMHVQELETISRHRLKVLIVAMNDGAYSSETHKLNARGLSLDGAVFGRTDFASVGRSFGLEGATVNDLSELPRLLAEFQASDCGAVWDIPISDLVISPLMKEAASTVRSYERNVETV